MNEKIICKFKSRVYFFWGGGVNKIQGLFRGLIKINKENKNSSFQDKEKSSL